MINKFNPKEAKFFKPLILFSVFIAGFCFMLFEINLFRAVSNLAGSTVMASTLLFSVFMGGYGFGALYIGKKAVSASNLYRFFSILLIITSIGGAFSYFSVNNIFSNIYEFLYNFGIGKSVVTLTVITIIVISLFIPSFLTGGILPIATKLLSRTQQDIPAKIGQIYALDTFGSSIGGLLTGFILNRYLGQYQTVIIASTVLLITGLLFLFSSVKQKNSVISQENNQKKEINPTFQNKNILITALFATLLFGFVVNGMQVILIRVFKIYLINAIYSFTLITSLIILGLFIGSWIFKNISQKRRLSINVLVRAVVFMGFLLPFILLTIINIPQWIMFPLNDVFNSEMFRVLGIPVLATIITVLPLSILSGFAFPLANSIFATDLSKTSEQIGKVVMFNTIGAVLGPLFITFIFVKFFGVSNSLLILSAIVFICSTILTFLIKNHY